MQCFFLSKSFLYEVFKVQFALNTAMSSDFCFYDVCMAHYFRANGDGEIRTLDPLLARQVLSQLSYTPIHAFRM